MNYFYTKNLHLIFMLKMYILIGKPLYTIFVYVKMAVEDQSGIILWCGKWQLRKNNYSRIDTELGYRG
jgi:hypothetical protein